MLAIHSHYPGLQESGMYTWCQLGNFIMRHAAEKLIFSPGGQRHMVMQPV